jgi:hypothetical protein
MSESSSMKVIRRIKADTASKEAQERAGGYQKVIKTANKHFPPGPGSERPVEFSDEMNHIEGQYLIADRTFWHANRSILSAERRNGEDLVVVERRGKGTAARELMANDRAPPGVAIAVANERDASAGGGSPRPSSCR